MPRRWVPVLLLVLAVGCATPPPAPDDDFGPVADFALVNHNGQTVRRADLRGKVWIASFTFTRCTGACLQVNGTMAQLQKEWAGTRDVVLVNFSVDPEYDTPAVTRDYAARFEAEPGRWLFLTGESETIYHLIREGFHLAVEQRTGAERTPGNEVLHSSKLAVVDRHGHIRGYFDGRQVDDQGHPVDELSPLRQKVTALLREKP